MINWGVVFTVMFLEASEISKGEEQNILLQPHGHQCGELHFHNFLLQSDEAKASYRLPSD